MNDTCTIPLDYHKEDKQGYHEMYRLVKNEQEMITELFPCLLIPTWKTTTETESEQKAKLYPVYTVGPDFTGIEQARSCSAQLIADTLCSK